MKKIFLVLLVMVACFGLTGCGNKNIEGSLEDIMEKGMPKLLGQLY